MARGRTATSSARPRSSTACRASRRSPARPLRCTRSRAHAPTTPSRSRSGSSLKRARLSVLGNESVGPYTLLRLERGDVEPGIPGQFFMLEAPGRLLPRPMSLCVAPEGELGFLIDPIGPGTRALCAARSGDEIGVLGPLGNGFRRTDNPVLVGGGIG